MSKDKDKKKDATKEKKLKRPREEDSKHPPSTTPLPLPSTTTPLESQKQTKQPTSTTSSTASTLASGEPKNKKIKLRHKNFIVPYVSPIASPKADETLSKVIFDSIKKANMAKSCFKGIKVIEKAFRKGEKGYVQSVSHQNN
ncbi:hypothetical protein HMI54_010543 [Coelomomyces lativittatus]|nr:hypothetical protein HMI54_010543 [Coelomomyces lativittatus]